jgi:hypothetical protein
MNTYVEGNPSVPADIGQINPKNINPLLLKEVLDFIEPIVSRYLPGKRSGYSYSVFVLYQTYVQLSQISPKNAGKCVNNACKDIDLYFQTFEITEFSNKKQRRCFPDQPALSRCLKELDTLKSTELFWNMVNFAHLLLLKKLNLIHEELMLIADYTEENCKKNKDDSFCFGKKEGKTCHKTLTFSIISNGIHQVIANYKIQKKQYKLPLFKDILDRLDSAGFKVKYTLIDRGFYRHEILLHFKHRNITVIMPGRKCAQTQQKILNYFKGNGKRWFKGTMKLPYVKGQGHPLLVFDVVIVARRTYRLDQIHRDLKANKITISDAVKRVFPLLVLRANNGGIKKLCGNERYIRDLYRCRWQIEIAFREMNKFGISNRMQNRDARLGIMGIKSFLYNVWQVQRYLIRNEDPKSPELELDEFLGKTYTHRYPIYISQLA